MVAREELFPVDSLDENPHLKAYFPLSQTELYSALDYKL